VLRVLLVFMLLAGVVQAEEFPDYLKVAEARISPQGNASIGDPVAATVVLEKLGPEPREAKLNISVAVAEPLVEVSFNDGRSESFRKSSVELELPEGLEKVRIKVYGSAPVVRRFTVLKAVEVSTYVYYDEENQGYQKEAELYLNVSSELITKTLETMRSAEGAIESAQAVIERLKELGVSTEELESRLRSARSALATAEELHRTGNIPLAKKSAENSLSIAQDALAEAQAELEKAESRARLKVYAGAGAALVAVVVLALLLLRRRRGELG